jgi:hypothetical protein
MEFLTNENIKKFGEGYVRELTLELRSRRKNSSGKLINSLQSELKPVAEGIDIVINAESYLEIIDKGRKPGKYPNIRAISKWASLKGIRPEAVFPIARKIYKFGIRPTNILEAAERRFFGYGYMDDLERDIVDNSETFIVDALKGMQINE